MSSKSASSKKNTDPPNRDDSGFTDIASLFDDYELEDKGGYITQEFQDYGYRLAVELDDIKHKSLYIKLAKETERGLLDEALSFVSDATKVKNKGKLFMWKLGQLKERAKQKSKHRTTTSKT